MTHLEEQSALLKRLTEEKAAQEKKLRNLPQAPGIYWARSPGQTYWNMIVEVGGEVPWLKVVDSWSRGDGIASPNDCYYGPKIEVPPMPEVVSV